MTSLIIEEFRGQATREQKLSKRNTFAECAVNAQLSTGALVSMPCPEEVKTENFQVMELYASRSCECVGYDQHTYIDNFQGNTYVVNEEIKRKYIGRDVCSDGFVMIGIPCPEVAPTVSSSVSSGCDFSPRQYMYTYVAKYSDTHAVESPPSPISFSSNCDSSAVVSNIQQPPAGFGINAIRIYRFDAGWKNGSESSNTNNSGCLLVGEIGLGQSSFSDNNDLSSPDMTGLLTYDLESMPSEPNGIGATAFSVFSWVGNELFISASGMPEVRTKSGRFCFDDPVVAAKYHNNSIYVFTERWNYRIDERASESGVAYSNPPYRFEKIMPILNEHSISVGASGVAYTTASGVCILSGNDMVVVSTGILNTPQWKRSDAFNARTFIYQQFLFIYSQDWDYTHVYEFEDGIFSDREFSNHTIYPYKIQSMYIDDMGRLLFSSDNTIYEFIERSGSLDIFGHDSQQSVCKDCCPYDYRMLVNHAVQITDYASGYIRIDHRMGDVTFELIDLSCGEVVVYEATFSGCAEHEFRLPSACLSQEHMIRLTGCATVYQLRLSTDAKDMGLNV